MDRKRTDNDVFWIGDLDLWPMTLAFKVNKGVIYVHALTKFHMAIGFRS